MIWGFILLVLFIVLAIGEEFGGFSSIDPWLTRSVQEITPRSLDTLLSFFSLVGGIEITSFLVVVLGLVIFKKERLISYSLVLFAAIMVLELIGKFYIYHPGPPREFFRYALPFSTPHYISSTYSFPSGHVARTAFLAVVAFFLIQKYVTLKKTKVFLKWAVFMTLVVMAFSRIYLGEHWASDVLGGLFLGAAFGFLAMVYY